MCSSVRAEMAPPGALVIVTLLVIQSISDCPNTGRGGPAKAKTMMVHALVIFISFQIPPPRIGVIGCLIRNREKDTRRAIARLLLRVGFESRVTFMQYKGIRCTIHIGIERKKS